jgi:hypothetical protein
MSLKSDVDKFIKGILRDDLQDAYKSLSDYHNLYDDFGKRIINSDGTVKEGAESFLSNSANMNKGEIRNIINNASQKLGIDINDAVTVIKNAMKTESLFPDTGSRTKDVVRSLLVGGVGVGAGGPVGGVALLAASSPKLISRVIQSSGKFFTQIDGLKLPKETSDLLKSIMIRAMLETGKTTIKKQNENNTNTN